MEYNENNAPLSATERAERWENATFFQKIALFFSEDFWQGFKEGFNETSQCADDDCAQNEDDTQQSIDYFGIDYDDIHDPAHEFFHPNHSNNW